MNLEFIDWTGGDEMPILEGTRVLVIHRNGEVFIDDAGYGSAKYWDHTDDPGDIMAYLVVPITSPKAYPKSLTLKL